MHGAEAIRSDESMCADTVWYVICVALASKGALYLCFEYVHFPIFSPIFYLFFFFLSFFILFFLQICCNLFSKSILFLFFSILI